MTTNYQEILSAARKAQDGLWELGDALLEQFPWGRVGIPNKLGGAVAIGLQEVSNYLEEHKIFFCVNSLMQLRRTAHAFPKDERIPGISVWTYGRARSRLNSTTAGEQTRDGTIFARKFANSKNISVLLDRAIDLASGCERISRGIKPSSNLAKRAIAISEAFGRVAAMLSPTRKEYMEQQ